MRKQSICRGRCLTCHLRLTAALKHVNIGCKDWEIRISLSAAQKHSKPRAVCRAAARARGWATKPATRYLGMQLQPQGSYRLSPSGPGLVAPARVERPPLHRGGSVSRGGQARPLLLFPPKPPSDKNNEGDGYVLTARVQRGPSEAARCASTRA
jgi:hypothetical protein